MRKTEATRVLVWLAAGALLAGTAGRSPAQQAPRRARAPGAAESDFEAKRLLKTARGVLQVGEHDRGVRILETILDQHPRSPVRFEAILELGKHYLGAGRDKARAIGYLRRLRDLKKPDKPVTGRAREMYLEGLYLTGVAEFETRNYAGACAVLRKITRDWPNTVWANQAYYYIGMCHFAQKHWKEAIRNLSLVGTFVDPDSPTVDYVEAGRRFFIKVSDDDLPVLSRLGKKVDVIVTTARGDRERVRCIPLSAEQGIYISSIATDIAPAKAGDHVLQVVGADEITVAYVDANTKEGHKDVKRAKTVRVVSTAALGFTVSTFESEVPAAFLGQPVYVRLRDVDLDGSDKRDKATVKVMSRYRSSEIDAPAAAGDLLDRPEPKQFKVRDEMTLSLAELGDAPVRSGRFGGQVKLVPHRADKPADKTDKLLACLVGDEIVAVYTDELHVRGTSPRAVSAAVKVIGEIDNAPRATQDHVPNPVTRARKKLVEATAFLELARIFDSMGLKEGARAKADEGLGRVDPIIGMKSPIPVRLRQEAFKLKWNLYMARGDYASAIATCRAFNRLYPDSPYVDEALMSVGKVKLAERDYRTAISVFRQVLGLPKSQAKAKAQFLIAEATAAPGDERSAEAAVKQYRLCAERYADSQYAGPSLAKLVQHHIDNKDYSRAGDLLGQVFRDHPDGDFLDLMLLKWVEVALSMGDHATAKVKCEQLIFSYPGSEHARKAKQDYLPGIKKTLEKAAKGGANRPTPGKG